jgi:hypothetical protein
MQNLSTIVDTRPANEAQVRPLTRLPAEDQPAAWHEAIKTAPNGHPTGPHVQQVVDDYTAKYNYKRDEKKARPADIYVPQGSDACQTPAYALDPLLPYLDRNWTVWEPASGEGLLVEGLYDRGFSDVIGTDLLTGLNFFEFEPPTWDCLVTNPPFSLKFKWLERCYQLGKPFALLLSVETLGAQAAQDMFREFGVEVIFLNKRVNFKMPNKGWEGGGAQFPTAWFTWGLKLGTPMIFARLDNSFRG